MTTANKILGISKEIEADATGAIATFHRIEYYSVDLRSKTMTLVVNGYVSQAAFTAGKQALVSINVSLQGLPPEGDDALVFAYHSAVAPAPVADPANAAPMPMMPHSINVYAGAQLVTE